MQGYGTLSFYLCDAIHVWCMLWPCVCLSIHPSITSWCAIEIVEQIEVWFLAQRLSLACDCTL